MNDHGVLQGVRLRFLWLASLVLLGTACGSRRLASKQAGGYVGSASHHPSEGQPLSGSDEQLRSWLGKFDEFMRRSGYSLVGSTIQG
ncbi:MAG: hypothetical protein NZL93_04220, partial [Chthoniobacterales bacterium]|nr:hypothetical protein [Chthoniobacterales bacterium]